VTAPLVLEPGRPGPLGAHVDGDGVAFAVRSRHATRIELCVFDADGGRELARAALPGQTGEVFHGRLPGAGAGLVYGLRAHGPYAPRDGHRFNPNKLLVDPYARELVGAFRWDASVLGYASGHPDGCDSFDERDSAPCVPKARVAAPAARAADRPPKPGRPWGETVLYELHVKGFSMANPEVPEALRGTIEGLAHPASIAHLERLGVTAVELLPVAAWLDELHLVQRGLSNYWGYNPIAFGAMQPALAGPRGIAAMRDAVDALHARGIEVILDVVFNHTAEGDERGPTLSLRGLDNATYYLPDAHRPGGYRNLSGCGNTLAAHQPAVGELIVDTLRFWADDVGVDGFRFDLASAIARDAHGRFDTSLPWLRALREDPVLARCKLVAEGWDCEGHYVGGFPPGWAEWNDRYRDDVRRFWLGPGRGPGHGVGGLATRLAGSSDLFDRDGRGPAASIDFITAHDGFTLADTVSYRHRRNHANGEDNRDGHSNEVADGGGAEGPTDDPVVRRRRARRACAMLATLMCSRGVPMLRAGDEFGASQGGNNNAYCQDGPTTWLRWPGGAPQRSGVRADARADAGLTGAAADLRPLVATLARLRAAWPCLRGEWFLHGARSHDAESLPDLAWLRPDGEPMQHHDWHDDARHTLALQLDAGVPRPGAPHDRVWIAFHAGEGIAQFRLPLLPHDGGWVRVLDTGAEAVSLEPDGDGTLALDGPAVAICCAGAIADAERARWRPGVPAAAFVPADDAQGAIELVLAEGDAPLELVLDTSPVRRLAIPGPAAERVEACLDGGRRRVRWRVPLGGPLPVGTVGARLRPSGQRGAGRAPADDAVPGVDLRALPALPALPAPRAEGRVVARAPHCWLPPELRRTEGAWSLSVQLYGLHSARSWGIGDFDDLAALGALAGLIGAAGVLVSPVHAPSLGWPDRGSPYSPSSRLALNPMFVSVPRAAEGFATPLFDTWVARPDTRAAIDALRAGPSVDWPAVNALKRQGLERLWVDFRATRDTALTREAARDFDAWLGEARTRLRAHLLFEALAEHHGAADRRAWPAGFEHPDTDAVRAFERAHPERVAFHAFVQWLAERQWRAAGEAARAAGAAIGPIADLAVGADPAGADAWSGPGLVDEANEIGAPPDPLGPDGQAWGLPPWRPEALVEAGFEPIAQLLRATMAGAGGLRIDHVMALERLFWVPLGRRPADGAYVGYPLEAMLDVVATESVRHRTMVIGEDLGTVRPGLRERLARAGILSYKVAWFERDAKGRLVDPRTLPPLAAVCASTHDLPTIDGWACGREIDERESLGLLDADAAARQRAERREDLERIEAGLAAAGIAGADLVERLHRWLAASTARLAIVQLEDVAGLVRQPNLPGTPDVPPNWRQKLPVPLEGLAALPRWRALASIFAARSAAAGRSDLPARDIVPGRGAPSVP
jgi:glycogen operon protein